jgi:hypothetical protein
MSLDISLIQTKPTTVWDCNITHNLAAMAKEAGLYEVMWRPETLFPTPIARNLIPRLQRGIKKLITDPDRFKILNPENGWGDYEGLLETAIALLVSCKTYPDAEIEVSR